MLTLRAFWKLMLLLPHILRGLCIIYFVFPKIDKAQRYRKVEAWSGKLLGILAIKVDLKHSATSQSQPQNQPKNQPQNHSNHFATGPVLLVANHISWLDIAVLHACQHCRFVSKADVKHWPLFGRLAMAADTLFIERESRRDAMRVVHHMCEALRDGDIVAVFPEGTTGNGFDLLPFHANLLQAAIAAEAPIQPIALTYLDFSTCQTSQAMSYVGSETLLGSIWRTLKSSTIIAAIHIGAPQLANGRDRRVWAGDLQGEIEGLRG